MAVVDLKGKTVLVTGAAGFIGSNLVKRLYEDVTDLTVVGIDNMNDYYDVRLKEARLEEISVYPSFALSWKPAGIIRWSIWYMRPARRYTVPIKKCRIRRRIR